MYNDTSAASSNANRVSNVNFAHTEIEHDVDQVNENHREKRAYADCEFKICVP